MESLRESCVNDKSSVGFFYISTREWLNIQISSEEEPAENTKMGKVDR